MTRSLSRLFRPTSVAVVGASAAPGKAGYQMVRSLGGFEGQVFPINPREESILGHRCYASLGDLPVAPDLVVLAVPAQSCPALLREAANAGAGAALIASGGFAESGEAGGLLQAQLDETCRSTGIRLLGPNTAGFAVPGVKLAASFAPGLDELAPGRIACVGQSAGVAITMAFTAQHLGYGVSLAVGLGNSVDVTAADVLEYLADDPDTTAVALHLEGVPNGQQLLEAIRSLTKRKPVVALTVGRNDIGAFAQSHTGNLIGGYDLKVAALRQAGAVVVETISDLIDAAATLSHGRLPPSADPGVGVVTAQAGPGLLMLDLLKGLNVSVPPLASATGERLAELLPLQTYALNPVDTGRPTETYSEVLAAVASDPAIDGLLVYALHEPAAVDVVAVLPEAKQKFEKPMVFGTMGTVASLATAFTELPRQGIPVFAGPERAARAVHALVADAQAQARRERHSSVELPADLFEKAAAVRTEAEGKALLTALDVRVPRGRSCGSREAAEQAFAELDRPLAVKIANPEILHKTEVGGVILGIRTVEEFRAALDRIDAVPVKTPSSYLIEEMAPAGVDMIVGGIRDDSFGPVVMVGLGGTEAELLRDTAVRLAPVGVEEAKEMIDGLRARALLDGWRGGPALDKTTLAELVARLSQLIAGAAIDEIDVNPVRVTEQGVLALDVMIVPSKQR